MLTSTYFGVKPLEALSITFSVTSLELKVASKTLLRYCYNQNHFSVMSFKLELRQYRYSAIHIYANSSSIEVYIAWNGGFLKAKLGA